MDPATPGDGPLDQDWVFHHLLVLLVVVSLADLIYYVFFSSSEYGGGGWGVTRMLIKPLHGGGKWTMYEHRSLIAAIALFIIIVLSLGGLFYYYCYLAGCFREGWHAIMMVNAPAGMKIQQLSEFARLYPLDQKDLAPALRPIDFGVNIPPGVEVETSARDYTPPQYLTLLFTDLGVLTPSVVSDELIRLYL